MRRAAPDVPRSSALPKEGGLPVTRAALEVLWRRENVGAAGDSFALPAGCDLQLLQGSRSAANVGHRMGGVRLVR